MMIKLQAQLRMFITLVMPTKQLKILTMRQEMNLMTSRSTVRTELQETRIFRRKDAVLSVRKSTAITLRSEILFCSLKQAMLLNRDILRLIRTLKVTGTWLTRWKLPSHRLHQYLTALVASTSVFPLIYLHPKHVYASITTQRCLKVISSLEAGESAFFI